jgi:signal transduction histidine kinase
MAGIVLVFGGSLYATQTLLNADASKSRLQARLASENPRIALAYQQGLHDHQQLATIRLPLSSQEVALLLTSAGRVLDARGPLTDGMIRQLRASAEQNVGGIDLVVPQSRAHGWWSTGSTYRVLIAPVFDRDTRVATLVVGLLHQDPIPFWAIWLLHGTLALLVAAVGGYWLVGKALSPVNRITRMANEINATDLRRRLHLQRKDEFGRLAATFDQMLARLEAAFQRQTRFAADASHELRTPLTIIELEINRALTQLERPEEYQRVLEQIRAENEQMIAMVNSLLLLARADTGQMTLDLQVVDLSDLALGGVERLLPLAKASQVALATGDLPEVLVQGDPQYLGQMLTNLIENAIKYTSGVGGRVHIELACE